MESIGEALNSMAKWTLTELATITGVTKRTVANWRLEGLPIVKEKRKRSLLVDSAEFFEWWTDRGKSKTGRGVNPDSADYWTKEKRRLEVQQMQGELLDRADTVNEWNSGLARLRKMVLSIPNRCAALVAERKENEVRTILDKEARLILRDFVDKENSA